MLKEVSRLAVVGQCAEALAELLKWEGFRILHPFHPLFGQACHTRSRLHFEQRAYAAAFDASRRALESVRARFSEHSVPRANAAAWAAALAATAKVETLQWFSIVVPPKLAHHTCIHVTRNIGHRF
jgi:hypothetical protein